MRRYAASRMRAQADKASPTIADIPHLKPGTPVRVYHMKDRRAAKSKHGGWVPTYQATAEIYAESEKFPHWYQLRWTNANCLSGKPGELSTKNYPKWMLIPHRTGDHIFVPMDESFAPATPSVASMTSAGPPKPTASPRLASSRKKYGQPPTADEVVASASHQKPPDNLDGAHR